MPDMGISEILAIIGAVTSVAGTGTGIYEQQKMRSEQLAAQGRAQRQQQEQSMVTREQQRRAGDPTMQTQTSGFLTSPSQQATAAQLAGNPNLNAVAPGGGSLTPAIQNLFPGGGVPSLTEPWPQSFG